MALQQNKTPMIVALIVVIVAALGFVFIKMRGPGATMSQSAKEDIARTQPGGGEFTPAPR